MLKAKTVWQQSETFNDGVISILKAVDGVIESTVIEFPYGIKTVGINRFYQAKTAGSDVKMVVSIPYNKKVHQTDLVELHDFETNTKEVYRIDMLQVKDTAPRSIWLTLVGVPIKYDDNRT